jgi:trans-aconitate methyltransferase
VFSAALHNRNISFSIVEGALSLVQEVQKRYPEVKIYHELFEAFTPAEQYDVILATHVLEHVDEPVALLKSMKAWLKPGGIIIVIVPNKDSIHRRLAVKMGLQPRLDTLGQRDLLVGHQRVYGLDTLRQDLEEAGYCVNHQTGFFLKVLPNSMMKGYSPELIKALNEISEDLAPDLLANIGVEASIA